MTRLTEEQIKEARALCEKATPGPWKHGQWQYEVSGAGLTYTHVAPGDDGDISIVRDTPVEQSQRAEQQVYVVGGCGCCGSPSGEPTDAAFIAASRTLVPALLDEVEAHRKNWGDMAEALSMSRDAKPRNCIATGAVVDQRSDDLTALRTLLLEAGRGGWKSDAGRKLEDLILDLVSGKEQP